MALTKNLLCAACVLISAVAFSQELVQMSPSGNYLNQRWVGYHWDGWSDATRSTGRLLGPDATSETTAYFNPTLAGYSMKEGWGGTFEITGIGASTNSTTVSAGSLYHNSAGGTGSTRLNVMGPANGITQLLISSGGSSTWNYDFSGMDHGYLPAGSMIWVMDLDSFLTTARHEGPLTFTSSATGYLDFIYQGEYSLTASASTVQPKVYFDGLSTYTFDNTAPAYHDNSPSDLTAFVTTKDLTDFTITSRAAAGAAHSVLLFAPIVPTPVPEPSSALLVGAAGAAFLLRRRQRRAPISKM